MDATQTLTYICLGGVLGMCGQSVRAFAGIKKEISAAKAANKTIADWFDARELVISLVIGTIAGILAVVAEYDESAKISKTLLMGFAAAGYTGADFIGGIMQKWLPK